jgi:hypothetical protein
LEFVWPIQGNGSEEEPEIDGAHAAAVSSDAAMTADAAFCLDGERLIALGKRQVRRADRYWTTIVDYRRVCAYRGHFSKHGSIDFLVRGIDAISHYVCIDFESTAMLPMTD